MDVQLLHRIYHFNGMDVPDSQDEETCIKLLDLFKEFSKHMVRENCLPFRHYIVTSWVFIQ